MLKILSIGLVLILLALQVVAQKLDNPILLRAGDLYLEENVDEFNTTLSDEERKMGFAYRLIQLNELPSESNHNELNNLGVYLQEYIPNNAYVARIPITVDVGVLKSVGVQCVSELPMQMKILEGLHTALVNDMHNKRDKLEVVIKAFKDSELAILIQKLAQNIYVNQVVEHANLLYADVFVKDIQSIAANAHVRYVDIAPEPGEPEHDLARSLHRVNMLNRGIPGDRDFDGTGVSVAVNDDGFVGPHIDFTGRTEQSDVLGDETGDHGDMVAGILGGAGNLDPTMRGMAPGSFIHVRQYDGSLPNTVALHQNDQVMIFNSSYGNGCNSGYTALTEQVDDEIDSNPALIQVFSCGNSGGSDCGYGVGGSFGNITGGHKIGKNVIATANLDESDNLQSSSSRGPSADGRLKPDLAANGFDQLSTDPNNSYSPGGGTSAASPGIAGVAAVLYQAYRELNGGSDPNSGLIKACMLNTAEDLGNPGPDYSFGWGRVNAHKAVSILENGNYLLDSVSPGATNTHTLNVPSGVEEIRIMLYWMEQAGSPSSSVILVNDLDLTVEDPSGGMHLPLVLDPTPNVTNLSADAIAGRDSLNNAEQVRISSSGSGSYTIHVDGYSLPFGQKSYYLLWDYLYDDIRLTYPSGNESFVTGEQEVIRWDAYADTGVFVLDYSIDGGVSWNSITGGASGGLREYTWTVPTGPTERALVRVSRGADSDTSDANFVISETPNNLEIDWVCPDSLLLRWDVVPGALQYEVSQLGAMYMDSIGVTTADSMIVRGIDHTQEDWFSVRAVFPNGGKGRRALAIQKEPGISNCTLQYGVELSALNSPISGTFFNCHNTGAVPVKVRVKNVGLNPIDSIDVSFQLNGGPVVNELFDVSMNPGEDSIYTFSSTLDFPSNGLYETKVWCDHPLDQFQGDDTLQVQTVVALTATLSGVWMQDFESFSLCGTLNDCGLTICNLSGGWRNESSSSFDDNDWRTDRDGTPSAGTGPNVDHTLGSSAGKYLFTEASGGCTEREALLITPCIDLSGMGAPFLSFWYHMDGAAMGDLYVDVFNGVEYDEEVWSISGNQGGSWQQASVDLSSYAGSLINIRFRGITGWDYESDMALDDIGITAPFSIPENQNVLFSVYPNPADEAITVRTLKGVGDDATLFIYDLLGKQIHQHQVSGSKELTISTKHLSEGTYVMVLQNGALQTGTKRFVVLR